jgi:hypothetical protein
LKFGSVSRTLVARGSDSGTRLGRLAPSRGLHRGRQGRRDQRASARQRKQGVTAEIRRHGVRRNRLCGKSPAGKHPSRPGSEPLILRGQVKSCREAGSQRLRHAYCPSPIAQVCAVPHGRVDGWLRSCAGHRYVAIPDDSLRIHIIQTIRKWPFGAKNSKESSRHRDKRQRLDQNQQEKNQQNHSGHTTSNQVAWRKHVACDRSKALKRQRRST